MIWRTFDVFRPAPAGLGGSGASALGSEGGRSSWAASEMLERVADGEIDRLMVLMPPGSAKSTYASLIFPAWWLLRNPADAIIAASHTADLAAHWPGPAQSGGRTVRYAGIPSGAQQPSRSSVPNQQGRTVFATGINGPVTGRRADLVLIDDPIKSHAEADSAQARDHLWNWYRSELTTRLKPAGRIVLIMTRWHEDDLGGRLLDTADRWVKLRLPALAEQGDPLGRQPGAALWPEWEDETALARKRDAVGTRVWQAQYQQAPVAAAGSLFLQDRVVCIDTPPGGLMAVRAWDLAATEAGSGRVGSSVGVLFVVAGGAVWREATGAGLAIDIRPNPDACLHGACTGSPAALSPP